ncbi:MAG: mechanosensitive ion channel family protein [Bacteroidetes bacterium]|nr:MAG: mechanosensitive ion channel family protein [Bacteroidota bacterium]
MEEFLQQQFFGNSVEDYLWAIGFILLAIVFERFLSRTITNLIFKAFSKILKDVSKEEMFHILHKPLSWVVILIISYFATLHLEYPAEFDFGDDPNKMSVRFLLKKTYLSLFIIMFTWVVLRIVDAIGIVLERRAEKTESMQDDQIIAFAKDMTKVLVIIFAAFIFLGKIFDVNVTSLIAGLGVGGLAVALAAKETLENLLGGFTIFLDKPFVIGDYVRVGNIEGTVERIGFRSTRIRTLEKSYLTVPNKKMVDAELDNFSLRTFRRVKMTIGLIYQTPPETIQAIIQEIQQLIDEHPHTNQDGIVRFDQYGASSLDIMVLYFIDIISFNEYTKIKEEINFKIMDIVKKHKDTDFAYPTQTIFIEKE